MNISRNILILLLIFFTSVLLTSCAVVPVGYQPVASVETESFDGDGYTLDIDSPVYLVDYPEWVFYNRYDESCDCIVVVRQVSSGGYTYWVDRTGRRVHEGHWSSHRPSAHALHEYRHWAKVHDKEFRGGIHGHGMGSRPGMEPRPGMGSRPGISRPQIRRAPAPRKASPKKP